MKLKIAVIITRSEIGGAQNYVYEMIKSLRSSHDVQLISGSSGYLTDRLKELDVACHVIPEIDSKNFFVAIFKIRSLLKRIEPDLVNTHSALASAYARLANASSSKPIIYSVHGWFFASNNNLVRRLIGPLLERCLAYYTTHWVTETNYDLKLGLKTGAIRHQSKASVIPNGVPQPAKLKTLVLHKDCHQLVFVGRNSYQKNPSLAIRVIAELPSNFRLTIYCDNAKDKALTKLIKYLEIDEKVRLIDDESTTSAVMQNYDLALCTSRYEGMPLVLLEAMAASLPVVAPDICGLNELVIDGENGSLIKEHQESAKPYANAIMTIFEDPALLSSMRKNALSRYQQHHTLEIMVASLASLFSRIKQNQIS